MCFTGGAGGGAAEDEALGLGERDVAAVRQGCDAQAATVADVLVVVRYLRVAYVHLHNGATRSSTL